MRRFCQTFQSPYKPSQASMLFHTIYLPLSELCDPCDCGQISENIFSFMNLLMQKIFFDKNHWFQLLSTKSDWIISLFLISITLHILSLSHSIMSSFCWQKSNLWLSMKTLLLLLTRSPNTRKFCFLGCSLSFFRFLAYWDHYCKFAKFDSLKPLKNVLTKSPSVTDMWIISFGHKVTWFTTA